MLPQLFIHPAAC